MALGPFIEKHGAPVPFNPPTKVAHLMRLTASLAARRLRRSRLLASLRLVDSQLSLMLAQVFSMATLLSIGLRANSLRARKNIPCICLAPTIRHLPLAMLKC